MNEKELTEYRDIKPEGFLGKAICTMTESTKTVTGWGVLIACAVLSAFCGGFYYPPARARKSPTRLNIFAVGIGESGTTIKTRPIREWAQILIEMVEGTAKIKIRIPDSFSIEGLISYLAGLKKVDNNDGLVHPKLPSVIWIKDEFGAAFKAAKQAYLEGLFTFLTELWEGVPQSRTTIKGGTVRTDEIYFSLLGACTPSVYKDINDIHFDQGFMNRVLMVRLPERFDFPDDTTDDWFGANGVGHDIVQKMSPFLYAIYLVSDCKLRPNQEAAKLWLEYRQFLFNRAKSLPSDKKKQYLKSYLARLAQNTLKLSGLHAVSRLYDAYDSPDFKLPTELEVVANDMKWAIGASEKCLDSFIEILGEWLAATESGQIRTMKPYVDEVKEGLVSFGRPLAHFWGTSVRDRLLEEHDAGNNRYHA